MFLQAIRSLLFYVLYFTETFLLALTLSTLARFHKGWFKTGSKIVHLWCNLTLFLLRWVVGIKTEITGIENIPAGGCIIASKHQSDWDIFALMPLVRRPAFIAKKELMDIPFFGRSARAMDAICIDRKRGGSAITEMNAEAKVAMENGCKLIIFPEGTRSKALTDTSYKYGIAKLYSALDVPIVPVAVNSGLFWGRNSLILWPGIARATIMPPLPVGMTSEDMFAQMKQQIEHESHRLALMASDAGISRPLSAEDRERITHIRENIETSEKT